jgi:nicotinamide mononucleotide transporter
MNLLEMSATAASVICVVLAVKRSLWQFPFGALSGLLYLIVFYGADLPASAALQIFFIITQAYGLWFWLKGENGGRAQIRSVGWGRTALLMAAAALCAGAVSLIPSPQRPWLIAYGDAAILCLSVLAQVLLDRKRLENWIVWVAVNVLAVGVYASQGLWLTSALYLGFFFNAFWGYAEWRREWRSPTPARSGSAWL